MISFRQADLLDSLKNTHRVFTINAIAEGSDDAPNEWSLSFFSEGPADPEAIRCFNTFCESISHFHWNSRRGSSPGSVLSPPAGFKLAIWINSGISRMVIDGTILSITTKMGVEPKFMWREINQMDSTNALPNEKTFLVATMDITQSTIDRWSRITNWNEVMNSGAMPKENAR